MSPQDLANRIAAAFERDEWINAQRSPISVDVAPGRVTLEGEVEDVATKRRAVALAEQELGAEYTVIDHMRRRPTENAGDEELGRSLVERLARERVFYGHTLVLEGNGPTQAVRDGGPEAYELRVSAADGVVRLSGTVGSLTHRRLAEVLAWWLPGCEGLRNELAVRPPQDDSDEELNDAVRFALELDPLVDATQLRISTRARVVSLEGLLDEGQKRSALHDVWMVPGVRDVADRIQRGAPE